MFGAAGPDFLTIHNIGLPLFARRAAQSRGVCTAGWFGHAKGLKAQIALCDLRQIFGFLGVRAMPQQRAHRIHLRMTGRGITARAVDFFQNRGSGRKRQGQPAIRLWYKRGQIARFGQSGHEGLRIGLIAIAVLPVAPRKAFA